MTRSKQAVPQTAVFSVKTSPKKEHIPPARHVDQQTYWQPLSSWNCAKQASCCWQRASPMASSTTLLFMLSLLLKRGDAPAAWAGVCPLHEQLCSLGAQALGNNTLYDRVWPLPWKWPAALLRGRCFLHATRN